MRRASVRELWKTGKLRGRRKSSQRSSLHDARTLDALFEAAGVADWDASLTENGLDSLKLTELIKVHASEPVPSALAAGLHTLCPEPSTNGVR